MKKDVHGGLEFAPHIKRQGSKLTIGYNLERNEAQLLADGYRIYLENPCPQDGKRYERVLEENDTIVQEKWIEHEVTDLEREKNRQRLFHEISDPMFVQVQRGALAADEYIGAVAQIKFSNRYSDEQQKNFADFFNEAAGQWNKLHPDLKVSLKAAESVD